MASSQDKKLAQWTTGSTTAEKSIAIAVVVPQESKPSVHVSPLSFDSAPSQQQQQQQQQQQRVTTDEEIKSTAATMNGEATKQPPSKTKQNNVPPTNGVRGLLPPSSSDESDSDEPFETIYEGEVAPPRASKLVEQQPRLDNNNHVSESTTSRDGVQTSFDQPQTGAMFNNDQYHATQLQPPESNTKQADEFQKAKNEQRETTTTAAVNDNNPPESTTSWSDFPAFDQLGKTATTNGDYTPSSLPTSSSSQSAAAHAPPHQSRFQASKQQHGNEFTPDVPLPESPNLSDLDDFDPLEPTSINNNQQHRRRSSSDDFEMEPFSVNNNQSGFPSQQQPPPPPQYGKSNATSDDMVIELLDDDEVAVATSSARSSNNKRKWPLEVQEIVGSSAPNTVSSNAAQASNHARAQHMPDWMRYNAGGVVPLQQRPQQQQQQQQPSYVTAPHGIQRMQYAPAPTISHQPDGQLQPSQRSTMLQPTSIPMKPGYVPTWKKLLPRGFLVTRKQKEQQDTQRKAYSLSVLNVSEFTISGASPDGYSELSSVQGLRAHIRQFSRDYGKAVFERDSESIEGGKWRIPLGAYQAFYSYLTSMRNTTVQGIPQAHLNIAMLGRQRLEKGFPSVQKLMHIGVPPRLAKTLAPFQRGGVDFVYERRGRALIADEMGLGKTIQAIASIAIYHEEWPVLVLSPSGARYHWQNEFLNWLGEEKQDQDQKLLDFGKEGESESQEVENLPGQRKKPMAPLLESQIHVLTSGSSPMLPSKNTKVVIVSYGLAPKLAEERKLLPGMFKCAIVDESHMLKNKNSKRTIGLMPILSATNRVILLSGTPAFARPMELWPQMKILGSAEDPSLTNEDDFINKYVKGRSKNRLAELHTVLTGTLMIRRMKHDILKQLPAKVREQALVNVMDDDTREEFRFFLEALRKGKGALAHIARSQQTASLGNNEEIPLDEIPAVATPIETQAERTGRMLIKDMKIQIQEEVKAITEERSAEIDQYYHQLHMNGQIDPGEVQNKKDQALNELRAETDKFSIVRLMELKKSNALSGYVPAKISVSVPASETAQDDPNQPPSRKAALIQMYKRTGQVKIPVVAEMLKLWLDNPAKGKLCIFAHHISVLNEIGKIAGLSNDKKSNSKFIRIDGSTNPKQRQEQINAFQKDPSIRVALLGITAAGVAVTLTAAATVWFAELFWTPALLVQAEDRCHRIGQQARVRCLYVVAKGTLDEILWKHIEKKFRDLGEFVEGKEKMKIVVHKTYRGVAELRKSLEVEKVDFDEEEEHQFDQMDEAADEFESELHQEIEDLEREEQEMLKIKNEEVDDDDADGEGNGGAGNSASNHTAGSTETEAICLSDDEEDKATTRKSLHEEGLRIDREFPELKLYKMRFPAPSCGLEIALFKGRVVVKGKANHLHHIGKPKIGDILLACNNDEVVPNVKLNALLVHFQNLMQKDGMIEFIFAEDKEFGDYFTAKLSSVDFDKDAFMHGESHGIQARIANLPTYKVPFEGTDSYGFGIETIQSAMVVTTISPSRLQKHGDDAPPHVGDILLAINGTALRPGLSSGSVKQVLATLKQKGMAVEITFAAADETIANVIMKRVGNSSQPSSIKQKQETARPLLPPSPPQQQQPSGEPEVIDLLED